MSMIDDDDSPSSYRSSTQPSDSGGAHLDLGAVAGIGINIGKKLDKLLEHQRPPVTRDLPATVADSNGWIIFPVCSEKKMWDIRRIAVMNTDPWTAGVASSLAAVCIGIADSGNVKFPEVRQPGTQMPFIATYSSREFTVKPGEQLYIIVKNGSGKEFATATVFEEDA